MGKPTEVDFTWWYQQATTMAAQPITWSWTIHRAADAGATLKAILEEYADLKASHQKG